MQINTDWEELLSALMEQEVRFLVVGGIAVGAYGHVRYTKDLDLWVEPSEENANRIIKALASFFGEDVGFKVEQFSKPELLVKVGKEPFRVDFITSVSGIDFPQAYEKRALMEIGKIKVPFISLEDLLITKKLAGRPQDLADLSILAKRQFSKQK